MLRRIGTGGRRLGAAVVRTWHALHFFEQWLLAMAAAMHLLFFLEGWGAMVWTYGITLGVMMPQPLVLTPAGMALVAAWSGLRARSWGGVTQCARLWKSAAWWGLTLRIWLAITLTLHIYIWLKLMIPLLNGPPLDPHLWRMEERVFIGFSPNRFILELFSHPSVLRFVDWSYPLLFYGGVYLAMILFPVLPSDRLRKACMATYVLLWTAGGWIHVLLPALGPCYWFPSVWEPYAEWLRNTAVSQAALIKNYQELTLFRLAGEFKVNPLFGVAAMPSMHNASQALFALWAGRWSRPAGLAAWISVGLIFLGSIVTGWHYLVDSVAGILLAWGVYAAVRRGLEPRLCCGADDGDLSLRATKSPLGSG